MSDTTAPHGTLVAPIFSASGTNAYGLADTGPSANPVFADIDGDGDFDLFVGVNAGTMFAYFNSGSAAHPQFEEAAGNPFGLTRTGFSASPSFADIDGDGDLDAFIGNLD